MEEPATDSSKTRFEVLKQELKTVIATLTEEDEFTLIVYCGAAERWKDRMTAASDSIKQQANEWIDTLELCEGTNIYLGCMTALKLAGLGDATDSRYRTLVDTIYFLSDGQPTVGEIIDPDEIRIRVREANKLSRIRINTIGVGDNDEDTNLCSALRHRRGLRRHLHQALRCAVPRRGFGLDRPFLGSSWPAV